MSLLKPDLDLSGNCVGDYVDLEIIANKWLESGPDLETHLDNDNTVDFKDYAFLADAWFR